MKRLLFSVSFVILLLFVSCSKEQTISTRNIEGSWGLVHFDAVYKEDGKIVEQESEDYNPFAPVEDEEKMEVVNTVGNNYLVSFYYWDKMKTQWVFDYDLVWAINGKTITVKDEDSTATIVSLTEDSFIIEGTDKYTDSRGFGNEVFCEDYFKMTFRRMGYLKE